MTHMNEQVVALRKAGKSYREIERITGETTARINYSLHVAAKLGLIERRPKRMGKGSLSRIDFADVIAETNDMRARGEI